MIITDSDTFDKIKDYLDQSSFFSRANQMPDHYEYSIPIMKHYSLLLSEDQITVWHGHWKISMEEFLENDLPEDVKDFMYFNIDMWRKN